MPQAGDDERVRHVRVELHGDVGRARGVAVPDRETEWDGGVQTCRCRSVEERDQPVCGRTERRKGEARHGGGAIRAVGQDSVPKVKR